MPPRLLQPDRRVAYCPVPHRTAPHRWLLSRSPECRTVRATTCRSSTTRACDRWSAPPPTARYDLLHPPPPSHSACGTHSVGVYVYSIHVYSTYLTGRECVCILHSVYTYGVSDREGCVCIIPIISFGQANARALAKVICRACWSLYVQLSYSCSCASGLFTTAEDR